MIIWVLAAALAGVSLAALGVVLLSPQGLIVLEILEKSPFAEFKRQPDSIPQAILRFPWALGFMLLNFFSRISLIAVEMFTTVFWPWGCSMTFLGGLLWFLSGVSFPDLPGTVVALYAAVFAGAYLFSYREGWVLCGGDLTERKSFRWYLMSKAERDE